MEIVLLIGLPGALGRLALGLGVFVLDKPPPTSVVQKRDRRSVTLNVEAASLLPSSTKGYPDDRSRLHPEPA